MTNARVAAIAMVRTMKKMATARQEQLGPPALPPDSGFSWLVLLHQRVIST
jgi:hypothetical protein